MVALHQYPFIRLLIPLAVGILVGDFATSKFVAETILMFLSMLFLIYIIHHLHLYKRHSLRWFSGLIIYSFLFSVGYLLIQHQAPLPINQSQTISTFGEISDIEKRSSGWNQITFKPFLSVEPNSSRKRDKWLLLVKQEVSDSFKVFDQVKLKGTLLPLESSTNPGSFDYGQHLNRKGYSAQMFISNASSIQLSKRVQKLKLAELPEKVREKCETIFIASGVDSTAMTVVKAILLGDRSNIDKDINQQFIQSGVIHILAVSGLHVGIIFLAINQVISLFLKPRSNLKWIIAVFLLIGYAFITGFSPSVSRAVLMFSIIQIGRSINREINMYQLVALSAFILLLIQPSYLFNMGFWLSHLAVVGIVAFYPIIEGWGNFKFPVWKWGWTIVSVSVAAQISTFPLSLYTFGAFPVYFLLSNILILPIVAPVLIFSILVLVFSPIQFIAKMFGGILTDLIHYMIQTTDWVHSLPASYIELIWVSFVLMVAIYIVIYYLYQIYITASAKNFIKLSIWISISLVIINLQFLSKITYSGMIIYETNQGVLIDLFHHGHTITIESEELTPTSKSYARSGWAKKRQVKSAKSIVLTENSSSIKKITINHQLYYMIHGFAFNTIPQLQTNYADGLILRGNNKFDLELLIEDINCPLIIAAPETPQWLLKNWDVISNSYKKRFYAVNNEGAKTTSSP